MSTRRELGKLGPQAEILRALAAAKEIVSGNVPLNMPASAYATSMDELQTYSPEVLHCADSGEHVVCNSMAFALPRVPLHRPLFCLLCCLGRAGAHV
jgi:hypothetical protein